MTTFHRLKHDAFDVDHGMTATILGCVVVTVTAFTMLLATL